MYKCGNYVKPETDDCSYKDDRCCYYCDKKWDCKAIVKCEIDCWNDDNDNKDKDNVNAYWEDDKE